MLSQLLNQPHDHAVFTQVPVRHDEAQNFSVAFARKPAQPHDHAMQEKLASVTNVLAFLLQVCKTFTFTLIRRGFRD